MNATRVKFRDGDEQYKNARNEQRRRQKLAQREMGDRDEHGDDTEGSLDPMHVTQSNDETVMNNLHSSYGTLNNSNNSLDLSAFQSCSSGLNMPLNAFQSPPPRRRASISPSKTRNKVSQFQSPAKAAAAAAAASPWNVKLRKTTPTASNSAADSKPTTSSLHHYNLLEEFATPRQWESPVKASPRKTPSTQSTMTRIRRMHVPLLELEDDDASSVTSHRSERSSSTTASTKSKKKKKKKKDKAGLASTNAGEKHNLKKKNTSKKKKEQQEKEKEEAAKLAKLEEAKRERLEQARRRAEMAEQERLRERQERARQRQAERALRQVQEAQRRAEHEAQQARQAVRERQKQREERQRREQEEKLRQQHHAELKRLYQAQIERLQQQLDGIQKVTDEKIAAINHEYAHKKKDWKQRALQRHEKNLHRPTKEEATVHEGRDIIDKLRKENATIRERNEKLFADIQKLQINNHRLEQSNAESKVCVERLQFHDETCTTEHSKLVKIEGQYKTAVEQHEEHLELHNQYATTETKIGQVYDRVLTEIVQLMGDKCRDQKLREEVEEAYDFLRNNDTHAVLQKEFEE